MSNTKASPTEGSPSRKENESWEQLPWRKLEKQVFRLQKRIYKASQKDNVKAVHKLQKLLMKSKAAQLIAVRRVTQDNQGKKTAGVDGVKSVNPQSRLQLAEMIHPRQNKKGKPKPVRRVWIPKPGKTEQRPLGIPTMLERCKQALAKLGLEPEWEARFEPNSYGFRPGRACQDAIDAIFLSIKHKTKYVLDADIKGCFDNINQEALIQKLNTYPYMRRLIKGWLKAGIIDNGVFDKTEVGTPQGGVISPLLANIALHGMEEAIKRIKCKGKEKPILIRYADDFVVFHSKQEIVEERSKQVTEFLSDIGLWLSPTKTRITHTFTPHEGQVGFDFLGFTIRQYPVGKHQAGYNAQGKPLGFKTIIQPSIEARKRHMKSIGETIRKYASAPQETVISELNPKTRGWANYYRTVQATRSFAKCDNQLWAQLWRWSVRRHPNKGRKWVKRKYWQKDGNKNWAFNTSDGKYKIRTHKMTEIQRHIKVQGTRSPYDGDFRYWSQRLSNHPMLRSGLPYLLKKQKGKCRMCELSFKDGDLIEIDHITPRSWGGTDETSNLMALHRHCHQKRHHEMSKAGITL